MKSKYLSNPDFNYEKVNRASLACGPMVKWAIAQVWISVLVSKTSFTSNFPNVYPGCLIRMQILGLMDSFSFDMLLV